MSTVRVTILDDDAEMSKQWCTEVMSHIGDSGRFTINALPDSDTSRKSIETLLKRQALARAGTRGEEGECVFDQTDILIVDYDLIHISEGNGRYTGEGICRLARAYSNCGIIIVLNQYLEADFDLRQRGNPASHADINLSSEHEGVKYAPKRRFAL